MLRIVAILSVLVGLVSCGGGGGNAVLSPGGGSGGTGINVGGGSGSGWVAGTFLPASSFAAKCAAPRSGTDPFNNNMPYPDAAGTATDENNFLRSWTNNLYLWYSEVPDLDPGLYKTVDYFPLLKTSATTASGNPKDKFHFTYATAKWEQLSQAGVEVSYGLQFLVQSAAIPRKVTVAYIQPATTAQPTNPALNANLARGASVLTIDGIDINANDQASIDKLNAALSPTTQGESHTFSLIDAGGTVARTVVLAAAAVTETPVQNVAALPVDSSLVGYMLFNDHIATAEQELIDAVNYLKAQNVSDLVLDIRYNGGGYLDIADELAYMIAGPGPTAGLTFEQIQFNAKHPTTDPVTGVPLAPTPFHTVTLGFSTTAGQPLPHLDLPRVFVLTGPDTCSASESIINGLRGVNIEVIQVGSTTCGKPYGFYPQDNCGTTYFSIQFQGVNNQGFGNYPDGFSPANTTPAAGFSLPGCSVADDFSHALGDPNEGLLSVALAYRRIPTCSVPPSGFAHAAVKRAFAPGYGLAVRSPLRENRILRQ